MQVVCRGNTLQVVLEGQQQLWSLRRMVEVDSSDVVKVVWHDGLPDKKELSGFRLPGTALPGVIFAGSFKKRETWEFWYLLMKQEGYLVIETNKKRYHKIRLSVSKADAEKALTWFNDHIEKRNLA